MVDTDDIDLPFGHGSSHPPSPFSGMIMMGTNSKSQVVSFDIVYIMLLLFIRAVWGREDAGGKKGLTFPHLRP